MAELGNRLEGMTSGVSWKRFLLGSSPASGRGVSGPQSTCLLGPGCPALISANFCAASSTAEPLTRLWISDTLTETATLQGPSCGGTLVKREGLHYSRITQRVAPLGCALFHVAVVVSLTSCHRFTADPAFGHRTSQVFPSTSGVVPPDRTAARMEVKVPPTTSRQTGRAPQGAGAAGVGSASSGNQTFGRALVGIAVGATSGATGGPKTAAVAAFGGLVIAFLYDRVSRKGGPGPSGYPLPAPPGPAAQPGGEIKQLPWPPPPPSARATIPAELLSNSRTGVTRLWDVKSRLVLAMDKCGYEKSYYAVLNDGFAIVTRIEQIEANGAPMKGGERWSLEVRGLEFSRFLDSQYWSDFFGTKVGYFRLFVFIVTPHPFSAEGEKLTLERAQDWLNEGSTDIPNSIGQLVYSSNYRCEALIYEFESEAGKQPLIRQPGRISGLEHLIRSKLWNALGG